MAPTTPTFSDVTPRVNIDELEREILAYWEKEKIFERSVAERAGAEQFTFYDGPPYATGKPHYGHILQSAIKDTVLRYKTMRGYSVPRNVGWDCHGLPVETLVEKELGFKSKRDIEKLGIEAFNQKCRDIVFRYITDFTTALKRMGRWADYDNAYATLDREYMDLEWGVFRQLWDKGLVYKDFRTTPYCVRCETPLSNFEVSTAYKDKTDEAVYVLFKLANQDAHLLVWTTTPWTLPGNAAVAFNPELAYVSVQHEGKEIVMAKDRVTAVFGEEAQIGRAWKAADLTGIRYEPPYSTEASHLLVASGHVTAAEGTGLVHIAPAFGEDDAGLGKQYSLPVIKTVGGDGVFTAGPWRGEHIFAANTKIVADLEERGLLLKKENYTHSYPFCWRCDTPLIYFALDTWFVKVTDLKEKMLALNEDIHWVPEHVKPGRFGKGIESAPDWAVSRNRFWSVPLPIWECAKCQERVCVGSARELETLTGQSVPDLHRPYVDKLQWQCKKCSGTMQRVPEVLDVWFDAGSMPYATKATFPADFIVESIEQTRLWFYVLHVLATALQEQAAFKNAIASGIIFAADGAKLSKKLKNYADPEETITRFGADALRLYLLTSSSLGEPYYFSEPDLQKMQRTSYLTLWNVYSFFVRYANVQQWQPSSSPDREALEEVLDHWILARVQQLENEVTGTLDNYQVDAAARALIPFIDDLSNWYVRRSRSRFQHAADPALREAAFATLYEVLVRTSKVVAPFMPFVADALYRNLTGKDSVHLELWPEREELTGDQQKLLEEMQRVRKSISEGLALRAEAKIKVRQPLATITLAGEPIAEEFMAMIKDELNVKEVTFGSVTELDTALTSELEQEGIAREIIRQGQSLRREANYALNDRIKLIVAGAEGDIAEALTTHRQLILDTLQADDLLSEGKADAEADIAIAGQKLHLGVTKT